MIKLLEKYNKLSWFFVVIIAIAIFYVSSLTFANAGPGGFGWKAVAYHFLAFFFLAFFLLPSIVGGKNKSLIFVALIIAFMYGISDEFHQLFVPGRSCNFPDAMVDSCGILFAGLIYTVSLRFRKNKNLSSLEDFSKDAAKNHGENKVKPNPR
jgi:hypothetical protein